MLGEQIVEFTGKRIGRLGDQAIRNSLVGFAEPTRSRLPIAAKHDAALLRKRSH